MILAGKTSPAVGTLQERISAEGCSGRVAFAGIRGDIDRLMIASDVLIFPSRGEGLGMAAVEAQAAGLPVLASTGVPRECVVVPELVEFRDVADGAAAWGDALLSLMERAGRVTDANARVAASAFAIEHSASALHRLYRHGTLT
jgi:glycosyltransferase involved in cell wall biosynthesis